MELVFKATDYGSTCPTGTPSALEICTKWNIKLPVPGNGCPPGEDDCYVTMCSTVITLWPCSALQAYTEAKAFCQNTFCPRLCHGMNCTTAAGDDDEGGDADSLESGITNDSQYTTGVTIATVASVSVIVIIAVVVIVALLRQRSRRTTESLS